MKHILLFFSFLLSFSAFAQSIEKHYFEDNPLLGGDVKIISAGIEVNGDEISKIFEIESFEDGVYYLDAWINVPKIGDKFVEYKISINGIVSGFSFRPEIAGWQSLALTDAEKTAAKVKLKKGANKVAVTGKLPMAPNVEFIKLSLNSRNAGIPDGKYREFIEMIKSNILNEVIQISNGSKIYSQKINL